MDLLSASCRVALAGLCHDLGKFAQRARPDVLPSDKDTHVQLYCPRTAEGYPTHIHAAFTALVFDAIEKIAPSLTAGDLSPFENQQTLSSSTDSLINCASAHHRPETFLQWIVATADRVASGFEREAFDKYNTAPENDDFYSARLLTLFEQIRFADSEVKHKPFQYAYPLEPLSVDSIFPRLISPLTRKEAVAQYQKLWQEFLNAVEPSTDGSKAIEAHRCSWPLWLDHFDSLWLAFTHCIPSATAFGAKPDVSLYDHSKDTAALATALWRWHEACGCTDQSAVAGMKSRRDWSEEKLLLIQGDCFGIQDFIFSEGSDTNKKAAKILRGRSFYVSLLSELAALRVLDALELPSTSQIINAAGKFFIVAHNTPEAVEALKRVQQEINEWFISHTFAVSGIGISWQPASCSDFVAGRFPQLQKRLFEDMERLKHQRYDLCTATAPVILDADYRLGTCAWNNRYPADRIDDDAASCALSRDQINIGQWLTQASHILVVNADQPLEKGAKACEVPIFGYKVVFIEDRTAATKSLAQSGALHRMWDISLPEAENEVLYKGCARRNISGHVPRFNAEDLAKTGIYDEKIRENGEDDEDNEKICLGLIKSFAHLACEDKLIDREGCTAGISALAVLKGDVDNLGRIFAEGLSSRPDTKDSRNMTFAKMASLSRQMNNFFSLFVPLACTKQFRNIYTVFAGGDDFFFVGPWRTTQNFATMLNDKFENYTTANPCVHFSAGLSVCKPAVAVGRLSRFAEEALEKSKEAPGKNSVTLFGRTVDWKRWLELQQCFSHLQDVQNAFGLSSGYLYGIFELLDLSDKESTEPTASIWRSRFRYRTARLAEESHVKARGDRTVIINALTDEIYRYIERYRGDYRIALTNFFYSHRQ